MRRFVAVAVASLGLALAGPSHAADISGVWLTNTGDAHIRIAKCGGNMCGTIIWLKDPKDPATGRPLADSKNPDPARRARPLLGIQIALGFHASPQNPEKFIGHFYNAEDGNTYTGSMTAPNADALNVEGCLAVFCQTQVWTRVKR